MKLSQIQEAKYHRTSYVAWIRNAQERISKSTKTEICSGHDGIKWDVSEWDQASEELIAELGINDDEEEDKVNDYKALYWRIKTGDKVLLERQMWYISLFTYGRIEEDRRLGICVSLGR